MHINKPMSRVGQAMAGGALLAIAVTASATGLSINVLHGLEVNPAAAILFGLADLTKETAENRAIPRRSVPAGRERLRHGGLLGMKSTQVIVFQ